MGGKSIGVDTNSADGWSVSWDTTSYADGTQSLSADATDMALQTATDGISVTVTNNIKPVSVTGISPNRLRVGTTTTASITWTGFVAGAKVTFENGENVISLRNRIRDAN